MSSDEDLEIIKKRKMMNMMKEKSIPNNVINVASIDNFNEIVNDYQNNLIIVDMWAPWCGPCKAFGPIYENLQKEYFEKGVIFTKVNVDELGPISQQFQVSGIPTTLFIKGKKLVHRQVGMAPKPVFKKTVDSVLEKISE